jgi:iron complex outermembrane receptor protein
LQGPLPIVTDQFATVTVIPAGEIERSPAQNLGDVMFTKPGITSTTFAPGSSRPVIRGQDNFRVRIQENGIVSGDVSDIGEDHGVTLDPLVAGRIEVIRGPATLRWGSQAIGGVVEVDNNRIPTWIPPGGFSALTKGGATTVDNGTEGAVLLDAGRGNFAFHADAFGRRADDYRIPGYPYLFPTDPAPFVNGRQPNSSLRTNGSSVGGSYLFDGGFVGVAVTHFASHYRIPGIEATETGTRIDLQQTKVMSKGEFRPVASAIDAIRFWLGSSAYSHDELAFENGFEGVQQTFTNNTQEGRMEVQMAPLQLWFGALTSAFGVQASNVNLNAPGVEGGLFDPNRTTMAAGYVFNELRFTNWLRMQVAGRIEQNNVKGSVPDLLIDPFVNIGRDRKFTPKSGAVGFLHDLPWGMVASLTAQYVERAPRAPELLSRGVHEATGTFDIGNPNLDIEIARSVEAGVRRALGPLRFEATAYYTRFKDLIFRNLTGQTCEGTIDTCTPVGEGGDLNLALWSQRDAIFRGAEVQAQFDVAPLGTGLWGVDAQYDIVRATFTDGTNVPRIPPQRVGGGIYWRDPNWFTRIGLLHAFAQNDPGENETPTAGYNLLRAEVTYRQTLDPRQHGMSELAFGIVGTNLLNDDVHNSASFKKDEVLLPGRGVKFFLNGKFGGEPAIDRTSLIAKSALVRKAPIAAPWSWAGAYLGGNLGYGAGGSHTDAEFADTTSGLTPAVSKNYSPLDGWTGGAQLGFNWQSGPWVAGVEVDFQGGRQCGRATAFNCAGESCNPAITEFEIDAPVSGFINHRLDWFGTLRGRVGATPTPESLLYVTGGLAVGRINTSGTVDGSSLILGEDVATEIDPDGNEIQVPIVVANTNATSASFTGRKTKAGWTLGAGIEGRLWGNWTGRVEYLYLDFGRTSAVANLPQNSAPLAVTFNSRVTDNIFRVGVNYKFN